MCVCVVRGGVFSNNTKVNNSDRWFYFKTYNKYNECIMTLKAENITSYAVYSRHLYRLGFIHKHLNMLSVRCFSLLKTTLPPRLHVSTITALSNCKNSCAIIYLLQSNHGTLTVYCFLSRRQLYFCKECEY